MEFLRILGIRLPIKLAQEDTEHTHLPVQSWMLLIGGLVFGVTTTAVTSDDNMGQYDTIESELHRILGLSRVPVTVPVYHSHSCCQDCCHTGRYTQSTEHTSPKQQQRRLHLGFTVVKGRTDDSSINVNNSFSFLSSGISRPRLSSNYCVYQQDVQQRQQYAISTPCLRFSCIQKQYCEGQHLGW